MDTCTTEKLRRQRDLALAWEVFAARPSDTATYRADELKSGLVLNAARKPVGPPVALRGGCKPPTPFKIRKILVPLDFSEPSKNALAYAASFAGEFGARLVLMHVISPITHSTPGTMPPQLLDLKSDLQREATEKLARWRATATDPENDLIPPPEIYVCTGLADVEINRAARAMEAHLIIVATHGFTDAQAYTLGSTTTHLVRSAPCPVLIVREAEPELVG